MSGKDAKWPTRCADRVHVFLNGSYTCQCGRSQLRRMTVTIPVPDSLGRDAVK